MLKRLFSFGLFFLCAILLTGCNQVRDLTEEETRLIAEYAVSLLLKHDTNYTDRIDEGDKEAEKKSLEMETAQTQENTEGAVTTEAQDTSAGKDEERESDSAEDGVGLEEPVGTESDIAKIAGIEGASITYKDYMVTDKYPAADEEGEYIYLEAPEGYQLLIVKFKVVSTSEASVDVSLLNKEIGYSIVLNDGKTTNSMLTILMEDLGTLETTVNPGEEQEAVLAFQISDDRKDQLETMNLMINYNEKDNMITILK